MMRYESSLITCKKRDRRGQPLLAFVEWVRNFSTARRRRALHVSLGLLVSRQLDGWSPGQPLLAFLGQVRDSKKADLESPRSDSPPTAQSAHHAHRNPRGALYQLSQRSTDLKSWLPLLLRSSCRRVIQSPQQLL